MAPRLLKLTAPIGKEGEFRSLVGRMPGEFAAGEKADAVAVYFSGQTALLLLQDEGEGPFADLQATEEGRLWVEDLGRVALFDPDRWNRHEIPLAPIPLGEDEAVMRARYLPNLLLFHVEPGKAPLLKEGLASLPWSTVSGGAFLPFLSEDTLVLLFDSPTDPPWEGLFGGDAGECLLGALRLGTNFEEASLEGHLTKEARIAPTTPANVMRYAD
ncbi:MAG TPA: hypothetical protein VNZ52_11285 [Candidatus Thermoplasmatota archaeon]|nr:hypothetical protein [Candidatus Thermoplasmatota archaeon]